MPRKLLDDEDRLIRGQSRNKDHTGAREPRERPSWRDLDRRKDRSSHIESRPESVQRGPKNPYLQERERKSNLGAANSLFGDSSRATLEKKILDAPPADLDALIDECIEKFGYPESFEVLSRFVEHSSPAVVKRSLKKLQPMLAEAEQEQRQALLQSLKLISMMGRNSGSRSAAYSFLRKNKLSNV